MEMLVLLVALGAVATVALVLLAIVAAGAWLILRNWDRKVSPAPDRRYAEAMQQIARREAAVFRQPGAPPRLEPLVDVEGEAEAIRRQQERDHEPKTVARFS